MINKLLNFNLAFWLVINACYMAFPAPATAQTGVAGLPFIQNYPSAQYQGGAQNYAIAQDPRGLLYFANEKGLLAFDGIRWNLTQVNNKTKLRSLYIDADKRIYAGSQAEIGYFQYNQQGFLYYTSLIPKIPASLRQFADVWHITKFKDTLYFMTSNIIFKYYENNFYYLKTQQSYDYIYADSSYLLVNMVGKGLARLTPQGLLLLQGGEALQSHHVVAVLSHGPGQYLVATLKDGFYLLENGVLRKWTTPADGQLRQHWINHVVRLRDQTLVVGSHSNGLLFLAPDGTIRYTLNKINNLQNNNVIHLFQDKNDNIWTGLNNGIDLVAYTSAFSRIWPDPENVGTGFDCILHQNNLYLAMNSGVYYCPWQISRVQPQPFRMIPETPGQAWQLSAWQSTLFLGHHDGTFVIQPDGHARRISQTTGSWLVKPLAGSGSLLCGTYTGIAPVYPKGAGWEQAAAMPGFYESSRVMAQAPSGDVWITHDYKGAYRISFTPDGKSIARTQYYHAPDGLPSDLDINVFSINDKLVFSSEKGVFTYDAALDRFVPETALNRWLGGEQRVRRLVPDAGGNIWFVIDDAVGYLHKLPAGSSQMYERVFLPELKGMLVENFECIYPIDHEHVIIGAKQGFIHFNPARYTHHIPVFRAEIAGVQVLGQQDSLVYGRLAQPVASVPTFESHHRAFRFVCATPGIPPGSDIQYSYQLEGLEKTWTAWSNKPEKDYTNLPPGAYTFAVRARNAHGQISATGLFRFRISTPWYQTLVAKAFYFLLIISAFIYLFAIIRRKYEREKRLLLLRQQRELRLLQQSYQLEAGRAEQELLQLRNEKLQSTLTQQSQELASSAMHLVQKGSILATLKDALNELIKTTEDTKMKQKIKNIIRNIEQDISLDNHWEQFSYHFDQVHNDFLQALRKEFPVLTQKDLQVCAYLRMGLSTKDVAALMNISVRGMEISRYRLRKKLNIPHEAGITEFLTDFNNKI